MPKDSFGDYDAEKIRNLSKRMDEFRARLESLAISWELEKFGTLRIAKDDQRDKSISFMTNFAAAVEKAIDAERKRVGRFTVLKEAKATKKPKA